MTAPLTDSLLERIRHDVQGLHLPLGLESLSENCTLLKWYMGQKPSHLNLNEHKDFGRLLSFIPAVESSWLEWESKWDIDQEIDYWIVPLLLYLCKSVKGTGGIGTSSIEKFTYMVVTQPYDISVDTLVEKLRTKKEGGFLAFKTRYVAILNNWRQFAPGIDRATYDLMLGLTDISGGDSRCIEKHLEAMQKYMTPFSVSVGKIIRQHARDFILADEASNQSNLSIRRAVASSTGTTTWAREGVVAALNDASRTVVQPHNRAVKVMTSAAVKSKEEITGAARNILTAGRNCCSSPDVHIMGMMYGTILALIGGIYYGIQVYGQSVRTEDDEPHLLTHRQPPSNLLPAPVPATSSSVKSIDSGQSQVLHETTGASGSLVSSGASGANGSSGASGALGTTGASGTSGSSVASVSSTASGSIISTGSLGSKVSNQPATIKTDEHKKRAPSSADSSHPTQNPVHGSVRDSQGGSKNDELPPEKGIYNNYIILEKLYEIRDRYERERIKSSTPSPSLSSRSVEKEKEVPEHVEGKSEVGWSSYANEWGNYLHRLWHENATTISTVAANAVAAAVAANLTGQYLPGGGVQGGFLQENENYRNPAKNIAGIRHACGRCGRRKE